MNHEDFNIRLNEDLTNQMTVNKNLTQEIIVTNTDKVTILLTEHHKIIKKKTEWLSPLGIFVTVLATLLTAKFDETVLGISPVMWKSIFSVVCVLSFILSIYFIGTAIRYINRGSINEFIKKLKNVNPNIETPNLFKSFLANIPFKKERLVIHSARYGAKETFINVTSLLISKIQSKKLSFIVNNANIGSDPIPSTPKQLIIDFSLIGIRQTKSFSEDDTIDL